MTPFLLLLGLADPLPPYSDYEEFALAAVGADHECRLCERHVRRLEALRGLYGYQNGYWDAAIEETRTRQTVWEAYHATWVATSRRAKRVALRQLRDVLGPERYNARWHPDVLPGDGRYEPVLPGTDSP
jgi:hypothetical protein